MNLYILDNNFKMIYNIDTFESLIWKERYNGYGEFEFYTPLNDYITEIFNAIREIKLQDEDCYVWSREYNSYMIIENMKIQADYEKGWHLIMSGKGLESVLNRRIIWSPITLKSKFQYAIEKVLNESIISPEIEDRKIENFIFKKVEDEYIEGLSLSVQYTGVNVYNMFEELCENEGLGFEVNFDENYNFVFKLLRGLDRSFEQDDRPYIVFSKNYENLLSSEYEEETSVYKNVALVAGEDINLKDKRKSIVIGDQVGLKRRELFVDARDIQSENEKGESIPESDYNELLKTRGDKKLKEHPYKKDMNCEIEAKNTFIYGKDFFIGDIVQVVNDFGLISKARVTEYTRVEDEKGYAVYPTFDINI